MTFIPFENIEYQSPLLKSEIEDVINSHVARTKKFGNTFSKNTYNEFEGFMEGSTFKIRRILKWGRNSPISSKYNLPSFSSICLEHYVKHYHLNRYCYIWGKDIVCIKSTSILYLHVSFYNKKLKTILLLSKMCYICKSLDKYEV